MQQAFSAQYLLHFATPAEELRDSLTGSKAKQELAQLYSSVSDAFGVGGQAM